MISDPIEFELFKNSLFSIADEMALTIFRTTYSGVLKDNMDYSTAMFDGSGKLAAQGLTLPGHLGSMPTAMAAIQEAFAGNIEPGDVYILNDPFQGGMHLPDIFVFKPIFCAGGLLGLVQVGRCLGSKPFLHRVEDFSHRSHPATNKPFGERAACCKK